jgi:Big-like domain-containing protein
VNRIVRGSLPALLVAALIAPVPASGWANNTDAYGTHDWILDQALKVLDGRVGWLDRELALVHTDDPDYTRDPEANEHNYRAEGRVGGAVDRIAYHYDLAQAAYEAHDYDEASIQIGLMSHYVGDLAEPYQTHMGGIPLGDEAKKYEQLVAPLHRDPNDTPAWSSNRRTVSEIENVRETAAGTAAYSRQYFRELRDRLKSSGFKLTDRVSEITGLVFKRAANDLADIIWSISRGVGAQPAIGRIEMDVKWTGVLPGDENTVYVRAFDVDGKPIQGLRVVVAWPTPTGTTNELLYTLPDGRQKRHRPVGTSPKLVLRPVSATAEVRGVVTEADGAWTLSPRLATGGAGFKTVVNDATAVAGQTVTVKSIARDADGDPVPNILVTWVWDLGSTTARTSGYTNEQGRATSSRTITAGMAGQIEVDAKTQAGSANRTSTVVIRRVD